MSKSETGTKDHLINQYTLILFVNVICFGLVYFVFFNAKAIAICCLVSGLLCLLTPLVFRVSQSLQASICYLIFSAISIAIFTALYTGGTSSPVLFWITAIPLAGGFLTRKLWSPVIWSFICILCFMLVWGLERGFGPFPNEIVESSRAYVHHLALAGITVINVIFTHLFEQKLSAENLKIEEQKQELEKALEKLRKAQADLIQSEKLASLGTLAAGIAHEINNAISSVSSCLSPIVRYFSNLPEKEREKYEKYTSVMREGLDVTIGIVNSLRSYTGLNESAYNEVEIEGVIQSVLTLIKSRIPDNVRLNVEIEAGLKLIGNKVGFHQIFTNLITNAVDALPNGGAITIAARKVNEYCEIVFSDNGDGIPEHILSKIYDPFFTTKEVGSGSGLGLYIVRSEVQRHHGTISVESSLGKGTTFKMWIPVEHINQ